MKYLSNDRISSNDKVRAFIWFLEIPTDVFVVFYTTLAKRY